MADTRTSPALEEERLSRASKIVAAIYAAVNLALLLRYALARDLYHTGLALGTLVLFPVLHIFYRLSRLKRIHRMDICIYLFALLAYTGGELLGGYARLYAYDKLAHMLSGCFVYMLAHPLFYFLKAGTPWKGATGRCSWFSAPPLPYAWRGFGRWANTC